MTQIRTVMSACAGTSTDVQASIFLLVRRESGSGPEGFRAKAVMPAARRVRHVPSAIAVLVASAVIASIAPSARGVRPTADEADAHAGAAQRVASDLFGAISDLAHFHANARARRIAALSMGRLVPKLSELGNGRGADEALAMSALHRAVRLDPDASVRRAAFDSLAFIRRRVWGRPRCREVPLHVVRGSVNRGRSPEGGENMKRLLLG